MTSILNALLHEEDYQPYVPDRIPQAAKYTDEGPSGDTLRQAINVCLRSHATTKTPPSEFATIPTRAQRQAARHAVSRFFRPLEQAALRQWATDKGLMLSNRNFTAAWKAGGSAGETENQIYFDEETQRWFKRNDLTYHGTYLEFFYRVLLHNVHFPEAPLRLEGFVIDEGMLKPVVSQPHVSSERGATQDMVDAHMQSMGFEKIPGSNNDYYNRESGVRVEDLHDENVLVDEHGDLFVIDPVVYLDDEGKMARIAASEPLVFESVVMPMKLSNQLLEGIEGRFKPVDMPTLAIIEAGIDPDAAEPGEERFFIGRVHVQIRTVNTPEELHHDFDRPDDGFEYENDPAMDYSLRSQIVAALGSAYGAVFDTMERVWYYVNGDELLLLQPDYTGSL